jgi:hypothetical protein
MGLPPDLASREFCGESIRACPEGFAEFLPINLKLKRPIEKKNDEDDEDDEGDDDVYGESSSSSSSSSSAYGHYR